MRELREWNIKNRARVLKLHGSVDWKWIVALSGANATDPSGVLKIRPVGASAMHGLARLSLDPKQLGLTADDAGLFYLRAFAQGRTVPSKFAFTNPIWGRYNRSCAKETPLSLDTAGNRKVYVCEGKWNDKSGSTQSGVAIGGPPATQSAARTGATRIKRYARPYGAVGSLWWPLPATHSNQSWHPAPCEALRDGVPMGRSDLRTAAQQPVGVAL